MSNLPIYSYPAGADGFYQYYVNNTFYALAPQKYRNFYNIYLRYALGIYDGWVESFYDVNNGKTPHKALQCVARGINNMLFASGIDFSGDQDDYNFAVKWAKESKLLKALKKAHLFDVAGGTSVLKLNRSRGKLFVSAHRIDTFYADYFPNGDISSIRLYYDITTNTNPTLDGKSHDFGICEERYFNENNIPCVRSTVYLSNATLETETSSRVVDPTPVPWEQLPHSVKTFIKRNYPSVVIGKEVFLPFKDTLGCFPLLFTDDIGAIPNVPLGTPIGSILFDEALRYDEIRYFEKDEIDLARGRALIPSEYYNRDDVFQSNQALDDKFYQQMENGESIVPIQFNLRAQDIKVEEENILRQMAFKLNISASSLASFLDEGASAMTATQIISEKTKTDTFIKNQIHLIAPVINELLAVVMRYYDKNPVEIVIKAEDQSPFLDKLKTYSDVFNAGTMSPEMFVKNAYPNASQEEQAREIAYLKETLARNIGFQQATQDAWKDKGELE